MQRIIPFASGYGQSPNSAGPPCAVRDFRREVDHRGRRPLDGTVLSFDQPVFGRRVQQVIKSFSAGRAISCRAISCKAIGGQSLF